MREFPAFLPHGGEHLAVVITVPDEEPVGLVLLLTGGAAARSHRFQLWTRTARRLAEERLASVRFDYRGTGDSTGELPEWHISDIPVDQALAVARFAMQVTGAKRLAVGGNCIGARVALEVAAAMPECEAAVCIRAPVLQPTALADVLSRARQWKLASIARSNSILRRFVVQPLARGKQKGSGRVRALLDKALGHASLLFIYCDEDFTFGQQVRSELDRILSGLSDQHRDRFELRVLPGHGLKGFESIAIQQAVMDSVVEWAVSTLSLSPPIAQRR
jgi:pimeloyl-ACP methyl ester carboxylesterase